MLANFRSYGWTLAVGLGALLAEAVVAQESTLDLGDPAISIVTPMLEPIDPTLVDADATLELDRETARAVVAPVSEDARPKCVPVAGPAAIKVVADKEAATECKRLADAPPTIVGPDGVPVAIVATPAKPQLELRLKERRFELDKRAADLDLQQSLLDAAEKKLDEKILRQLGELISFEIPIHPSVIRHFDLQHVNRDTRYAIDLFKRQTFEEYMEDYIHFR